MLYSFMENETEERTSAIGYLNYGKSYLDSAVLLTQHIESQTLCHTKIAPIYHLYGLAFELLFKAIIRTNDATTDDFKRLGHDLEKLAKESECSIGFGSLISNVNSDQKEYWRELRIKGREELLEMRPITSRYATIDNDEEIEKKLPDFMATLESLNRNYCAPFHTRYFLRGSKTYPVLESLHVPALMLFDRAEEPCIEYSKKHKGIWRSLTISEPPVACHTQAIRKSYRNHTPLFGVNNSQNRQNPARLAIGGFVFTCDALNK